MQTDLQHRRAKARAAYLADPECKTKEGYEARDELCRIALERRDARQHR